MTNTHAGFTRRSLPAVTAGLALLLGCGSPPGDDLSLSGEVVHLESPALEGSGEPNLFAADDGSVYLSWFDRLDDGEHALRFARMDPSARADGANGDGEGAPAWGEPRTIVSGENFFVNWADFPSIHTLPDGTLAAHWLVRSGPDTYDYEVHLGWSEDGGETWEGPVIPHRDGTLSEHGFVSLVPWGEGEVGAVWLDGREFARSPDDPHMTLRFTTLRPGGAPGAVASSNAPSAPGANGAEGAQEANGPEGAEGANGGADAAAAQVLGDEILLDDRVCDCCQTSAARTDEGAVVVYRDRSDDEIRDIWAVRHTADGWSEPRPVHDDGWEIPACPVNGPMVAAEGSRVVVAWFTAANDEPLVRAAFSDDGGRTFGEPIRIDDGDPSGRVAVVTAPDGRADVSWLERTGEEGAEVRVRRIDPAGERGESVVVARSSAARASGFPRMVRSGDALVFAWRDMGETERVEVSLLVPEEG